MNTLKFNSIKSFQEFIEANPEVSGKVVLEFSLSEEVKKNVITFANLKEYHKHLENNRSFTGTAIVLHSNGQKWYEIDFVDGKRHGKQHEWHDNGKKAF